MEFINRLVWTIFHLSPWSLNWFLEYVGNTNLYVILFAIVFAETGLVVTPFLPGDSLLFAVGAVAMIPGSPLNLWTLTPLLIVAAIIGDAVNYWIGYKVGPAIFRKETGRILNKKHLIKAQEFYDKYGGKTIILARFVPIVRTFAPFVAGIGRMNFFKFWMFNIIGAVAWVLICVLAGVFFGRFEFVQKRFELVIIAIIFISLLPIAIEFWKARRAAKAAGPVAEPHPVVDAAIQATTTLPAVEEDAANR
ncbi:MAG TPA: VTT domain-containing protein [Tepidisphaeraceae bacterium]|nr:VTT domain-containing protein [Tepidisphaeraceae bacterium]